jgi:hypothetical protein
MRGSMKIVEVRGPFTYWVVETDTDEWPVYRRNGAGDWENLMGESWEPSYFGESTLEVLFQAYISDGIGRGESMTGIEAWERAWGVDPGGAQQYIIASGLETFIVQKERTRWRSS